MDQQASLLKLLRENEGLLTRRIETLEAICRDQARCIDSLRQTVRRKSGTAIEVSDQLDRATEILTVFRLHLPGYFSAAEAYVDAIRGGTNPQAPFFIGLAQPGSGIGSSPLP